MKKFLKGFTFAFNGLKYAFTTQVNFRVHTFATIVAVALGIYFHISPSEWCWIAACIAVVLITELLNTSIEILTDMVSPGYNVKAGHIKDISAGAVLVTAIFAVIVAGIIFIPKL
ncbi:diacylglycerol kinase family protein [Mucilaginibacter ginkgonis]|uniref:Diacylglycerol kinase family protein n=1 Tax=Mucilaginibacter ginkgonis TaxID=2682091 RepID=A0A6I4HXG5_9SPHI|nr:diacylglycerol kinase family protein [Mucilaginibacter ginkgonis]QQL49268.1 diacylglycerol kinase family protein [Mucilaginibacter ginkgonis]